MAKLIINSYEEFASHLGERLGESEWLQVDQERINKFADATLDPQWIHVDVERAKVESPTTALSPAATSPFLCYPTCGSRLEVHNIKMLASRPWHGRDVISSSLGSRNGCLCDNLFMTFVNSWYLGGVSIKFDIEIEGQRKPS